MPKENIFYSKGLTIPKFEVFISVVSSPNICKGNKSILEKEREVREIDEHRYMSSTDLQAPVKSKFMSATDLQAPLKVNLLRNLIVSWKRRLCHHMKTSSWEMSISIQTVKTAGQINSIQFCQILILFNICQHLRTNKDILDVLCTSKSLTSSVDHYVKDGISDHLAVFFTTTFLVINSCRVKRLKIRKLGKINKTQFMSDIANSELIQVPYKTATLLSHRYFHTLRNLLDKHSPIHERKTPQYVNKGFINSEILAAKRRKSKGSGEGTTLP